MKITKLSFLIALFIAAFIFTGCPSNNNSQTSAANEIIDEEDDDDKWDDGDDEWDDLDTSEIDYDYIKRELMERDTIDF